MDPSAIDALEEGAAARLSVAAMLRRRQAAIETPRSSEQLRDDLADFDRAESEHAADAAAERARLVSAIEEAEHAERLAEAHAHLLAEAKGHAAEAHRLDELADTVAAELAEIDAELTGLEAQRHEMEAAMRVDASQAERLLTSDAEQAAALAVRNAGRQAALQGLGARIGEARQRRLSIEAGADLPAEPPPSDGVHLFVDGVDTRAVDLASLRARARWHAAQAARCRVRAEDDPLGEATPEQVPAPSLGPLVAATLLAASRLGRVPPPTSAGGRAFGFPSGSIGEGAERIRRRRG